MKEDKGKTNERNLYPSEKAVYDLTDKTLEVINVDVESEIAWKEGRLVFKETPLPEVLRCLANFYNVDFKVMDPVLSHDTDIAGQMQIMFSHFRPLLINYYLIRI